MESQILQFYRISLDSHQMDVKSSIRGIIVHRFVGSHVVYQCQWCLSVRDREKKIETGGGQMSRTRKGEPREVI